MRYKLVTITEFTSVMPPACEGVITLLDLSDESNALGIFFAEKLMRCYVIDITAINLKKLKINLKKIKIN